MAEYDLNSLEGLLSEGGVSAIARRCKVKQSDVAAVLNTGIPTLLTGMKRNTGKEGGESSLRIAAADHSGADLSDVGAFVRDADLKDGKKILDHVLCDDKDVLIGEIAERSGVSKGKATSILALAAPLLLTLLGNQQSQQTQQSQSGGGLDLGNLLGGLLGGQQGGGGSLLGSLFSGGQSQQQSGGGLLGGLLGGQQSGGGLLGGFFGGGQQQEPAQPQQEQQSSGGFLDSFLNLFR